MKIAQDEWLRRVDAEYQSAAATAHYTLWLIQAGASPDLIRDGLRIVDDEIVHAELSHKVYLAAGGTRTPTIDRDALCLERRCQTLEEDLLRVGVGFYCLGETVAVPLFQRMRKQCSQTEARTALDRILVDEVRHRDFGWALLDWLLETPQGTELRRALQQNITGMLRGLIQSYRADAVEQERSDGEQAWGLISGAEYAEILERCFHRDYRPRFSACGIDIGDSLPRV